MLFGALCFVFAFIHIYLQLFGRKPTVKMGIVCIVYIFKLCCAELLILLSEFLQLSGKSVLFIAIKLQDDMDWDTPPSYKTYLNTGLLSW